MICPFCLHEKTFVFNSRKTIRLNAIWRRRRCEACKKEFTTQEMIDCQKILRVTKKNSKKTIAFSRAKLLISILKSCDHRSDNGEIAYMVEDATEQKLLMISTNSIIDAEQITEICASILKNVDTPAYLKYLTYHVPNMSAKRLKKELRN